MTMELYDWANSYNSRKILAVAFETDQSVKCHAINMQTGENKSPEYLAKNPNGKVPLLADGNFNLWESNAIACYIASKDPTRRLLPSDPQQRAHVDQWLFWQTAHLSPAIGKIGFERIWKKRLGQGDADESIIQAAMPEVNRFVGVLDQWLATHEFVAGNLSVADFCLAAAFSMRNEIQLEMNKWPNVTAWLARIESRPSWQSAPKSW
jgi:glutathione S-transferase